MTNKKRHSMQSERTLRLAKSGVLVALGLVLGYLESLIPPFTGIPGVKPGFANIAVMIALYVLGTREAITIALIRVILSGLTFGSMFSMLYSLAGATLSILTMVLLKRVKRFSSFGISIAGGEMHNLGQLCVAVAVTGTPVLGYMPVLLISGCAAGAIVGIISGITIRQLQTGMKGRDGSI